MSYPITRRHFSTFKRAFGKYMNKYNLGGWHVEYYSEAADDALAWVKINYEAHRVDVYLNTSWDEEPARETIYVKAQHEVIHVLLAKMSSIASRRCVAETDLTEAEEELVIRLMQLLPAL